MERCNDAWVSSDGKDNECLPDEKDRSIQAAPGKKWDQFKHFKPLRPGSGVQNYDESFEKMYSTPLDMNSVKKEQLEFAKQKAEEIASKKTDNVHLAEERGQDVDDKNMDSEDRYSGVLRTTTTTTTTTNSSSSSSSNEKKKVVVKSKLNAKAKEWVPTFKMTRPVPPTPPFVMPMPYYPQQMYGMPPGGMMMPQFPRGARPRGNHM